jgi:hypothetical protein
MSEPGRRAKDWEALEAYAAKAELERIDALSDAAVEAELRAAGMSAEPPQVPGAADSGTHLGAGASGPDGGVAYDAGGAPSAPGRVLAPKGGMWRRLPRESFAYAAAAAVIAVLAATAMHLFQAPDVAKPLPPDPNDPTHQKPPPVPQGPTPEDPARVASELRQRAKAECDRGEWDACLGDLADASAKDAAGETSEWKALREKARARAAEEQKARERKGK